MMIKMKIKEIRKSKCMSLDSLAKKSGVSISHISAIENGYKMPTLVVTIKIAKALNMNMVDLFRIDI